MHYLAKPLYFSAKPYFLAKVRGFAKKYPSFPNRHVISGIKNPQKEGFTTHRDEPHQARNPLISSHFSTLSPNRSKFLWHQLFIAACAAVNDILNKLIPKVTTGVHFFDHWVQNDHGVFIFSDHGVQMPLGEGSKVTTPSADRRRFSNLPYSRQGIPATANVPEPLVSAIFLIFCSFPLYQISGLHFYVNALFDTI